MIGGAGNDTSYVDNIGDLVTENAGKGTDLVLSSITYTLGANLENLTLTGAANVNGTGNGLNNLITGNNGVNILTGGVGNDILKGEGGNDTLNGGGGDDSLDGGAGSDTMAGGAGNDTYTVNSTGDVVTENAGAGTDSVNSSLSYTLGANLENLNLSGTADINGTGNSLDNSIWGNSGDNVLTGGAGNDSLLGQSGADTMAGGTGDDVYYVDDAGDVATEGAGAGEDRVASTISYTLGANLERLRLTGTDNTNGTGNGLDNTLIGNTGTNVLTGGAGSDWLDGGEGADTMTGGTGDDIYTVDNAGDVVTEAAGAGNDWVATSMSYTLPANVETLQLTGEAGVNGTGNSLGNKIYGNSGNNVLNGGGGSDTITAGAGNDTLNGGSGADTLEGEAGNDRIVGGAGNDSLAGGSGADSFVYTSTSQGGDRITDFTLGAGNDFLDLTGMNLNISPATLPSFLQFSYDGTNTHVLVDADGGGDNFVEITVLQGVHMTAADMDNYAL
jgi:Ca2+-binding RTX toxin-like protein